MHIALSPKQLWRSTSIFTYLTYASIGRYDIVTLGKHEAGTKRTDSSILLPLTNVCGQRFYPWTVYVSGNKSTISLYLLPFDFGPPVASMVFLHGVRM
jgi:hypothetical protein